MPSAGTSGPNVPRLTSPVKRVAKDGGGMDPPPSQPSSRASSATKRDTAGLITDLTRLKEITNDTRIQSPTYRKDHFDDFDDEPDLPEIEVKEELPREVSFGDLEIKDQDLVDDLSDLDEAEGLYDDNASQVSSLSTEPDLTEEYDTDLEVDEDRWINPEKYDIDTTGRSRYLQACEEIGVQPATYFLKHMSDTHLVMKFHGLGPDGMRALAESLKLNTVLEKIDLEGNFILEEGTTCLTRVLKDNCYVTELVLSDNKVGNEGAKAICELLTDNKTIIHLDLAGNDIQDDAAEDFYEMLTRNAAIKTLLLRHNKFEDKGAEWFNGVLNENVSLETLDLSWNCFQSRGCIMLCEAIKDNVGMKYLDLSMNGLGIDGARALEDSLKENKYLEELNISYCRIPTDGCAYIAAGLQINDTLKKFNVGYNPFSADGGYAILVGTDRNEQSALQLLDFGNLMVRKEFKDLYDKLKEERQDRKFTVKYGGVLLDSTRFGRNKKLDPFEELMNDPMTKLKDFLEKAGYRLIDLFKTFDRDQSWSIDLSELKEGIKKANIDLTDEQIEELMKKLDKDKSGTIEFNFLKSENPE